MAYLRRTKSIGIYFFLVSNGILFLLFFTCFNWFMIHMRIDWKQLMPAINAKHFSRPILVIESDDWGWNSGDAKSVGESYREFGYNVPPYAEQNALETPDEVRSMVDILVEHKDSRGKSAVLTANMIMANIDFEAVRQNNLTEPVLIPLDSDSPRNPVSKKLISEYKNGVKIGVFWPQLHGLCHINRDVWLKGLRENEPFAAKAFLLNSPPLTYAGNDLARYSSVYLDFSVSPSVSEKYENQIKDVKEAVNIFQRMFKFLPKSTIAPFYVWDDNSEEAFYSSGIRYIQGANVQQYARDSEGNLLQRSHDLGQLNDKGLYYLTRNITFEPQKSNESLVASTEWKIKGAFLTRRPATIITHRLNYVGVNAEKYRKQLDQILGFVENDFPSVLYMSSDELGSVIEGGDSSLIVNKHSVKNYFFVVEDILVRLPGVWYPILLACNIFVLSILIYRRLRLRAKIKGRN